MHKTEPSKNNDRPTIVIYHEFTGATWRLATVRGESRIKNPLRKGESLDFKEALRQARVLARKDTCDVAIVINETQRVVFSCEEFTNSVINDDDLFESEQTPAPCPWCGNEPEWVEKKYMEYRLGCRTEHCDVRPQQQSPWSGPHEACLMWNMRLASMQKPRRIARPGWKGEKTGEISAVGLLCVILRLDDKIEIGYSTDGKRYRMENGDILSEDSLRRLGAVEIVNEDKIKSALLSPAA